MPRRSLERSVALSAAFLLGLAVASASAGDAPTLVPKLADGAASPESFAPGGWAVEHETRGDLNGDGLEDAAFVLRPIRPDQTAAKDGFKMDADPRIFAVAIGYREGFRLAAQNTTFIPVHESYGVTDSFEGSLKIEGGALAVFFDLLPGAGSWHGSRTYKFKLRGQQLSAIGFDMSDVDRGSGGITTVSINYLTGRMSRSKGSIERDEDDSKVWSRIAAKRPPTIEDFGDATEFDPTR